MRLLAKRLREHAYAVLETAEPGGTPIGLQIRRILLDNANQDLTPTAELLLMFGCRAQNVEQWILPALECGTIVLSDRFTDSSLAYQGAGRGLGSDVVLTLDGIACHGLKPDLTIYIDIDLATSLERALARNRHRTGHDESRLDRQAHAFHEKARDAYLELGRAEPDRFRIIDGRAGIGDIAERVWREVEPLLRPQVS